MSTKIAVNLPVKDLADSTPFFAELGLPGRETLTNQNMQAFIIGDDIYVLLVARRPAGVSRRICAPSSAAGTRVRPSRTIRARGRPPDPRSRSSAWGRTCFLGLLM
jgi:hypothetical protein